MCSAFARGFGCRIIIVAAAGDLTNRVAPARVDESFDALAGKQMHIRGPSDIRGPIVAAVHFARRPINGDPALGKATELLVQKRETARAGSMRIDQIAGKQQKTDSFG